jgi:hypothetical protein
MKDHTQPRATPAVPDPTHVRDLGSVPGWDGRTYRIQVGRLDDRWFARVVADDDPFYLFREFDNEQAATLAAETLFVECQIAPELRFTVEGSFASGAPFHISLTGGGNAWHLKTRCDGDEPRFRRFNTSHEAIVEMFIALVFARNRSWQSGPTDAGADGGVTRQPGATPKPPDYEEDEEGDAEARIAKWKEGLDDADREALAQLAAMQLVYSGDSGDEE